MKLPTFLLFAVAASAKLLAAAGVQRFWRSDHYGELSKDVLSQSAFVIETL